MRVGKLKESGGRMTEQKAIEIINCNRPYEAVMRKTEKEAFDMAIQSLEKQIPKKPNIHEEDILGEYYSCPSCMNNELDDIFDNYCPRCGQKLDWSEEE